MLNRSSRVSDLFLLGGGGSVWAECALVLLKNQLIEAISSEGLQSIQNSESSDIIF